MNYTFRVLEESLFERSKLHMHSKELRILSLSVRICARQEKRNLSCIRLPAITYIQTTVSGPFVLSNAAA